MSWIVAFAMLAQQSAEADWLPRVTLASTTELRARVLKCGVAAAGVSIRDDRDLQEPVVRIARSVAVPDTLLSCLAQASLESGYYVEFADAAVQSRYAPIYAEREQSRGIDDAKEALRRHGLLDRLPVFDGKPANLASYAGALEKLCRVTRGSLLQVGSASTLTIRPDVTQATLARHPSFTDNQFVCVLDAVTASNLDDYGISFGFIGNAKLEQRSTR